MKIRWLIPIAGTVEGQEGVKPGDIMEVPDFSGKRYIANGYAEEVKGKSALKVEHATVPDESEKAIVGGGEDMGGEAESEPHFPDKEWVEELSEPTRPPAEAEVVEVAPAKLVEPEPKKTPVKRTPRTPRRSK